MAGGEREPASGSDSGPPNEGWFPEGDPAKTALSFGGLTEFMGRAAAVGAEEDDLAPGTTVGDVRVVKLLGAGGMGRVYEGIQASTQRTVAVKVIRAGVVSATAARRLAHEAQILGRLSHPGIARIYSGGVTRIGGRDTPYFVLEYVERPRSITAFVVERQLSRPDRVRLFRGVCAAVAHGHARGVVHRDLKPGNVLVDASGQPKIIDFGVARSTTNEGQLTTMHTGTGEILGTAQYMAPEQLVGTADDIGAPADVYALGLIFYEVLTGALPYDVRQRPIYEVARVVREVDPKSLDSVDRQFRGDLTAIVATCLDKDPCRRYPNAAALAADLDRHLAGVPVVARPPGFLESLARLAGRHRSATLGAAGVLLTLVLATLGMSLLAVRAERQRMLASASTALAQRQLQRANVRSLQSFLAARNMQAARSVYEENLAIVGTAVPLEMRCLGGELDEAIAVAVPTGDPVVGISFSPDGSRLDATTVSLPEPARGILNRATVRYRPGLVRRFHGQTQVRYAVASHGSLVAMEPSWSDDGRRLRPSPRAGEILDVAADGRRLLVDDDGRVMLQRPGDDGPSTPLGQPRGRLRQVVFVPGAEHVVMLGADGRLDLWDGKTGEFITSFQADDRFDEIQFSPDGSRLAVSSVIAGAGVKVDVFRMRTGDRISSLRIRGLLASGDLLLGFSADGSRLATVANDSGLQLWNVDEGRLVKTLSGNSAAVTALVWSADDRQIAVACQGGRVVLWDVATGTLSRDFMGHAGDVLSLAFTRDGTRLASGGLDGTVRIWAPAAARPLDAIEASAAPTALAFRPTGRDLAVAQAEGPLEIWTVASVERRLRLPLAGGTVAGVTYSAQGDLVAAAVNPAGGGAGAIHVWDAESGRELARLTGLEKGAVAAAFSADGTRVVTTARDGAAAVWSLAGPEKLWQCRDENFHALAAPLAMFGLGGEVVAHTAPSLFDAATGRERHGLIRGQVWCLTMSSGGRVLARGMAIGRIYLAECATGRSLGYLDGHTAPVLAAAFSADARRLVTGSADGTARIWDLASMTEIHELKGHEAAVHQACFTPDESRVVTASADGTVRIWSLDLGVELCQFAADAERPRSVALSPDGRLLVTSAPDAGGWSLRIRGLSNAAVTSARDRVAGGPPAAAPERPGGTAGL